MKQNKISKKNAKEVIKSPKKDRSRKFLSDGYEGGNKMPDLLQLDSSKKIGNLGEDIACQFLTKHGFEVIQRNYLKKWGEIDIIAKKSSIFHFIEVKTVSRESKHGDSHVNLSTIHNNDTFRPEDNVDTRKRKKISRTIQTYFLDKSLNIDSIWSFDLVTVVLHYPEQKARVNFYGNLIL